MTHKTIIRYLYSTIGLFFIAFGSALSIKVNLGTTPLSCIAYVISLRTLVDVAIMSFAVNTAYLIIQLGVLREKFKALNLLQFIPSVLFCVFLAWSLSMIEWMSLDTIGIKLIMMVIAALVIALGISMEVTSNAWMTPAEMTVAAIKVRTGGDFDKIKIWMDILSVVITALLAIIFFKNPFGLSYNGIVDVMLAKSEGVVIGLGTIVLAVLPGYFLRFTDTPARKLLGKLM